MEHDTIIVIYGSDERAMTERLLRQADMQAMLPDRQASIVLKPNLVVSKTADSGAVTHPGIIETTIVHLKDLGYHDITIAEGSWVGDSTERAFKVNGYDKMAERYGVKLIDLKRDRFVELTAAGITMQMAKTIIECDFLISFPVLKGHCQTAMTCALKNMKGCLSDRSKRYFHSIGLHEPIAALNLARRADLVIVDSLNGDLDFEEGGTPVATNRMFTGRDSVLIDAFSAGLMGFDLADIPYIALAEDLGVGSSAVDRAKVVELNQDLVLSHHKPSMRVKELAARVQERSACSACYGNLIHALARLDEKGILDDGATQLCIGQDFKGKTFEGLGIGSCTKGGSAHVAGCPPKAIDIVKFLENQLRS